MTKSVKKILGIDDRKENLFLMKELLAVTFPEIIFLSALTGVDGLRLCEEEKPDVVLLDIMMPDMDGFEVCKRLKAKKSLKHIPVVMVTAAFVDSDKDIRVQALDAGADAFLAKPIDQSEFKAQVHAMLRIKESEDQKITEHEILEAKVLKRTEALFNELEERRLAEAKLKLSNEHLEKSKITANRLLKELKLEINERRQAEERVKESLIEQKVISDFSTKLVSLDNLEDVYHFAGQTVSDNVDDAYVFVTVYNLQTKSITVKFVFGIDKYRTKIEKLFGLDPFLHEISIFDFTPEELSYFRSQQFFEPGEEGIHFLFARSLPLDLCKKMEAILSVKRIYTMGFTFGQKVYGGISILARDENFGAPRKLLETLVVQTSVALQRLFIEQRLKISEKMYRSLVETSPDGIVMLDLKGNPLTLNRKIYEIFGYAFGDVDFAERNILEFLSPSDRERAGRNYTEIVSRVPVENPDYIALRKDGTVFQIETNSSLVLNEKNEPFAVISIIRDITKRKLVEVELVKSRELYKLIADKMSDVVWLMDLTGKSIFVSPSITRFNGFTEEEYLKQTIEERFTKDSATLARKLFNEELTRYKNAPERLKDFHLKLRMEYVCKNKRTKWGELVITPLFDNDGVLAGIHGVTRDITERVHAEKALIESEKKYQFIVENTDDILWIMDENLKMEYTTPSVYKFLGYTVEENLNQTLDDYLTPESVKLIIDEFRQGMINLQTKQYDKLRDKAELEVEFIRKDNTKGYARITMVMLRDEQHRIKKIRGITTDITKRKLEDIYAEISNNILKILNEPTGFRDSIRRILEIIKNLAGFDAVGIRLQEGDDFPYFEQIGFAKDFMKTENSLVGKNGSERATTHNESNYCLECNCGLVLAGKTIDGNDLYTPGGSFWTNNSFALLGLPSSEDPRFHPRNKCIYQGYASLALVPIRCKDKIVGLIHLSDRRKGRFTLEVLQYLESIALHIGTSMLRRQAEIALKNSEEKYRLLARNMVDVLSLIDRSGKILYVNNSAYDHLGYIPDKIIGTNINHLIVSEEKYKIRAVIKEMLQKKSASQSLVCRVLKRNNQIVWLDTKLLFIRNEKGRIISIQCVSRDITEKIEAENRLENERRKVMSALIDGQELERQRLSMELHDGLGQKLAGIKIKLENAANNEIDETRRVIDEVKAEFWEVIEEIRAMSMNVSPTILSNLGLIASINMLCKQFIENYKIEMDYSVLGNFDDISEKKAFYIYRIVQEGLNNIAKHSEATMAKLALIEKEEKMLIILEDNGKGFIKNEHNLSRGNGLSNMRQRTLLLNGDLKIDTGINSGTVIMIKIPK
ncbi:MAG TPA: PAS domain S-box protein [Bacteroidales bacterium]|nr:PAS domain S-box protein [Bacteroidales bacterium]